MNREVSRPKPPHSRLPLPHTQDVLWGIIDRHMHTGPKTCPTPVLPNAGERRLLGLLGRSLPYDPNGHIRTGGGPRTDSGLSVWGRRRQVTLQSLPHSSAC